MYSGSLLCKSTSPLVNCILIFVAVAANVIVEKTFGNRYLRECSHSAVMSRLNTWIIVTVKLRKLQN